MISEIKFGTNGIDDFEFEDIANECLESTKQYLTQLHRYSLNSKNYDVYPLIQSVNIEPYEDYDYLANVDFLFSDDINSQDYLDDKSVDDFKDLFSDKMLELIPYGTFIKQL